MVDAKDWSIIQGYLILGGGAALFGFLLGFLDRRARRHDRKLRDQQR